MKFLLRRERQQPSADCTLGFLFVGSLSLVTIERPWVPSLASRGGAKGVSCVPLGTYRLVKHDSELHPLTWALVNEDLDVVHYPGPAVSPAARTAVLIHPANWAHELRGCIGVGTRARLDADGRYMVEESRKAMRLIQAAAPWTDEHTLEIT